MTNLVSTLTNYGRKKVIVNPSCASAQKKDKKMLIM